MAHLLQRLALTVNVGLLGVSPHRIKRRLKRSAFIPMQANKLLIIGQHDVALMQHANDPAAAGPIIYNGHMLLMAALHKAKCILKIIRAFEHRWMQPGDITRDD